MCVGIFRTVSPLLPISAMELLTFGLNHTTAPLAVRERVVFHAESLVQALHDLADAKIDPDFVVMARTDALAVEGLEAAIERACACVEAGADMIFPEAITELSMYRKFADAVKVPILANITEFGSTPLFSTQELASANVAMALYPLSAWRAANAAALKVYEGIRKDGHQKNVVALMQSRDDLYDYLGYHEYEKKLDALFEKDR